MFNLSLKFLVQSLTDVQRERERGKREGERRERDGERGRRRVRKIEDYSKFI